LRTRLEDETLNDLLRVYFTASDGTRTDVGEIDLSGQAPGEFAAHLLAYPHVLVGQVGTLTFELAAPGILNIIDSEVLLDDVLLTPVRIEGFEDYFLTGDEMPDGSDLFTLSAANVAGPTDPSAIRDVRVRIEFEGTPDDRVPGKLCA